MSKDSAAKKKNEVIEALTLCSKELQIACQRGDTLEIDRLIGQRTEIFSELEKIDTALKGQATAFDSEWLRKLESIKPMNEEISTYFFEHRKYVETAVKGLGRSRKDILENHKKENPLKGGALSVKA